MTERIVGAPLFGVKRLGVVVVEIRRQIAIVVGTRVGSVIPVERRRRVERLAHSHAGVERHARLRSPNPVDNSSRVERFHHLGVAFLALLPTPARVVEIVAGEVVCLLERSRVGSALGRSTKSGD